MSALLEQKLDDAIKGLSTLLYVSDTRSITEYSERIKTITTNIERTTKLAISDTKFDLDALESVIFPEYARIQDFIGSLNYYLEQFCTLGHAARFYKHTGLNLVSVNYFGYDVNSYKDAMKVLSVHTSQEWCDTVVADLSRHIASLSPTRESRMLTLVVVTYSLRMYRLCSAIAEYLYWGAME